MKLSIITPAYNCGDYIDECIKSVMNQNHSDVEHLVIDGCSTDNTLDILKNHDHLTWISEPDKGQSDALNKGFKMAKGEILGWLNADDYYRPNVFSTVIEAFEKNPDADIIYGNWSFVNENGEVIKKFQTVPFNLSAIIYYGPYLGSTALFFRKEIVEEGILIDERFKFAMDWEWYARLGSLGKKFRFVNQNFANFRIHGDNMSLKFRNMSDMDKYFTRARQLAEGYAIKRCYGHSWGKNGNGNIWEDISYRLLWWIFYGVVVGKKAYHIFKGEPNSLASYSAKRKIEVNI